ncbi:hypothetical protein Agub_g10888, partial [Astrephomene gubernaculifera]
LGSTLQRQSHVAFITGYKISMSWPLTTGRCGRMGFGPCSDAHATKYQQRPSAALTQTPYQLLLNPKANSGRLPAVYASQSVPALQYARKLENGAPRLPRPDFAPRAPIQTLALRSHGPAVGKGDGEEVAVADRQTDADNPVTGPSPPYDPGRRTDDAGSSATAATTSDVAAGSTAAEATAAVPDAVPSSPYKDLRALDAEILSIALPMLATLAADPIAGLVDSAYLGRAGSSQLAAVGVALSVFNTATKLFNVPLLAVTTSSVAKATGAARAAKEAITAAAAAAAEEVAEAEPAAVSSPSTLQTAAAAAAAAQARAASSCIWLAALVGLAQAALLLAGGQWLVRVWGVAPQSPVYEAAVAFLLVRAAGAPVTILMLTLQGVFRGLQDTRTPFQATLVSNAINIALAPLLVFGMKLGAVGAAAATVAAQALPLGLMARELCRRLPLFGAGTGVGAAAGGAAGAVGKGAAVGSLAQGWAALADVLPLFKPTGFLVLRSASVTATYAVATTLVARAGPAVAASHQICFQLWLACSLLADALAVAAQSLMARDLGAGCTLGARQVAGRVSRLSLGLGLLLAGVLAAGGRVLPGLFSTDPEVLRLVANLFPIIAATQPITVLAMAWDGILYGTGGFRYAAVSMAVAAVPAMLVMQLGGGLCQQLMRQAGVAAGAAACVAANAAEGLAAQLSLLPLSGEEQLGVVWAGLMVMMLLRWLTIAVPYAGRWGPFRKLRAED